MKKADSSIFVAWSSLLLDNKYQRVELKTLKDYVDESTKNGESIQREVVYHDPGVIAPAGTEVSAVLPKPKIQKKPRRVKSFHIVTGAQNRTPVMYNLWRNINAYLVARSAFAEESSLTVMGVTYEKTLFVGGNVLKPSDENDHYAMSQDWSSVIEDHVTREDKVLCGVRIRASANITPTLKKPLTGITASKDHRIEIYCSPSRQLQQVPRHHSEPPRMRWTSGFITAPNYIRKKQGLMAEQFHCYGFMIIEEDFDGNVFVRDVNADEESGSFYDLDTFVIDGKVMPAGGGTRVLAAGDAHFEHVDPRYSAALWGIHGNPKNDKPAIDALNISHQIVQDCMDFTARNHHVIKQSTHWYRMYIKNLTVESEFNKVTNYIDEIYRDNVETIIVEGNHDVHVKSWLHDYKVVNSDAVNSKIWYMLNYEWRLHMDNQGAEGAEFSPFKFWLEQHAENPFTYIQERDSMIINGIQFGMHSHNGVGGKPGSTQQFAHYYIPVFKGHDHKLEIFRNCRSNGFICKIPSYVKGLVEWCPGFTLCHPDGNAQSIELIDTQWRA